jgi:hypothetical protein
LAAAQTSGLVAAYAFNEGTGTTVADISGRNNTGTLGSGVTWTAKGRFGSALVFDGSSYVTVPDDDSLDLTTGMTLAAWVYPTTTLTDWSTVLLKEQPGELVYALYAGSPDNRPSVYFNVSTRPGGQRDATGPTALPRRAWSYLTSTYDGSTLRLYINGALVASRAVTKPITTSTDALRIGGNTIWGEYFKGRIDEVRIYDRALSQSEIENDMHTAVDGTVDGTEVDTAAGSERPSPDTTCPSVAITTPTSGPAFTTSTSPLTVGGTATDDRGVTQVVWANDRGGSGPASGTTSWSASGIELQPGANVVTITARDAANNACPVTLTVTYVGPRDPALNDSQVPGSLIVFPKFIRGTTATGEPLSEFEISVVCPKNLDGTPGICVEGTRVKLRAHWVCPGSQTFAGKLICRETDFDLFTTVFGTVTFNPANVGAGSFPTSPGTPTVNGTPRVPIPPCERGYLIAWVVDTSDRPIKYEALIGNALLREPDGALSAYNGIPIQAHPALATNALIASGADGLAFDGTAGNYQAVTSRIRSSVRFEQEATVGPPATPAVRTDLTLLTLDVLSNAPNYPTRVNLDFYNANEFLISTFWEFVCWTEVSLGEIDPNLTVANFGTTKGLVVSDQAQKFPFLGINDVAGPVTLLGIVTTVVTGGPGSQSYSYSLYNDSVPVPTAFVFGF